MKAIVLTCDRFRAMTDHMIFKYAQLWPTHPYRFRVPYQDVPATQPERVVEYVRSPVAIKATVFALLEGLDDNEMVYWCIDDKYPIRLDVPRVEGIARWLAGTAEPAIDGVLFCRCRKMWEAPSLTGQASIDDAQNVYLERNSYAQIWIHQFLRVKVLRHLFASFPDAISTARAMDQLKDSVAKPATDRIFVSRENLAVFGESTSFGVLTANCHDSICEHGLALPPWHTHTTNETIVMGTLAD